LTMSSIRSRNSNCFCRRKKKKKTILPNGNKLTDAYATRFLQNFRKKLNVYSPGRRL
jgi:hypothetical protein